MNLFNIARTFKMKETKGWPEIYWCIDLHGTIIPSGKSSDDQADYMKMYPNAKEVLQWLNTRRDIMTILWTSTPDSRMPSVLNWFESNGIRFTYVNENPHAKDTPRSVFNKKFYFSVLLDDRAGFEPEKDWWEIKNELIRIGQWELCSKGGEHQWGTDGQHSNEFCKKCFTSKPRIT
jgi:hypothetical protein